MKENDFASYKSLYWKEIHYLMVFVGPVGEELFIFEACIDNSLRTLKVNTSAVSCQNRDGKAGVACIW